MAANNYSLLFGPVLQLAAHNSRLLSYLLLLNLETTQINNATTIAMTIKAA
jgi:hypothetical protein